MIIPLDGGWAGKFAWPRVSSMVSIEWSPRRIRSTVRRDRSPGQGFGGNPPR
jgi:hypothetical protein